MVSQSSDQTLFIMLNSDTGSHSSSIRMFNTANCWIMRLTSSSTTYVGQIMAYEEDKEPNAEVATRTGALAMLFYSLGQPFDQACT